MKKIIAKILEDPSFTARYRALGKGDAEGLAQLVRDAGFEASEEQIAQLLNANGELSEEDLRQVAGGFLRYKCDASRTDFR